MRGDDLALATLAESVADGTPVDWQAAEIESPRARRLVSHLRLVDSIAALHRSIPSEDIGQVAPPAEARTPRGQRWGRLVLLEQIGSGTSCDVFRAWDAELHRDVALKLLHDEAGAARSKPGQAALQSQAVEDGGLQARVLHEARRMARLRHEHVVQVYGAEQHDGRVGLWMELVRGTSLEDLVQQRGPLGPSEAALIGLDLCAAIAAVHGSGLLHRDIKAQNVMREDGGRIVLMDFGTGEDLAGTNRLVGTPLYLAPEIFKGERGSVQSDIYALGVLLYYLVTGKFPVTASTMPELARAHHRRERRPLRDLRPDAPQAIVGVVERALDSDPARRYRSIGDLETALREALVPQQRVRIEDKRPEPTVKATPDRDARWRPSLPVTIAAAIALLVIAVALIVWTRNGPAIDGPPRIAVMPFRADASAAGSPHLADRLTDELIATLGQVKSLQVPSLSTVLPFKNSTGSLQQIGKSLQVGNLLDATLSVIPNAAGKPDRVRVRARLLTAGSGGEIWAQEFERSLGDMRALHAEIARGIVRVLNVTLTPEENIKLRPRPTSPAANDAYYLGMHLLSQSSVDAEAVAAFRRAIALDPDHAGAHAGLARGLMTLGFIGHMTHNAARATAAGEVRRALELDPDSAEAQAVQADLQFFYDWDWGGADQSYRRAIDLNPSFARARSQYARFLAAAGRPDEATWQAERGVELEPTSASAVSTRAMIEYYKRDFPSALASADQAIRLEPQSGSAYFVRARVVAATNDIQNAIQTMERAIELRGKDAPTSWRAHLLRLRAQANEQAHAQVRADLDALIASVKDARQVLYPTHVAYVHEALGDREAAIQLIERAAADRDPDVLWLNVDPRVDSLRTDPRFMQVIRGLDIPQ